MAVQSLDAIILQSANLAYKGKKLDALNVLKPLDLSGAQKIVITALFENIKVSAESSEIQTQGRLLADRMIQILFPCFIADLSDDIFNIILSYLRVEDIFKCSRISKKIGERTQKEHVYQNAYERNFNKYSKDSLSYFAACKRIVNRNQLHWNFRNKNLFENFGGSGISCVTDKYLIIAKRRQVFVYDLNAEKLLDSFKAEDVNSIAAVDGLLYLGSATKISDSIVVRNITNRSTLDTFNLPSKVISSDASLTALAVSNKAFCTGHADGRIRLWNSESKKILNSVAVHECAVSCLLAFKGKFYSGSIEGTIHIYDLNTQSSFLLPWEHKGKVSCLALWNKTLCSGYPDGTIKFWDLNTGKCLQTSREAMEPSLVGFGGKFYSTSLQGKINVWDQKGQCLQTLQGVGRKGMGLAVFQKSLFLISFTNVAAWDFNSEYLSLLEMASLFKGTKASIDLAMALFSNLPHQTRDSIFSQLKVLLNPFSASYKGYEQDAFYGRRELSVRPEVKASAIEEVAKLK